MILCISSAAVVEERTRTTTRASNAEGSQGNMLAAFSEPPARLEADTDPTEEQLPEKEEEELENHQRRFRCARPLGCLPFASLRSLSRVWTNCWFCFSDYGVGGGRTSEGQREGRSNHGAGEAARRDEASACGIVRVLSSTVLLLVARVVFGTTTTRSMIINVNIKIYFVYSSHTSILPVCILCPSFVWRAPRAYVPNPRRVRGSDGTDGTGGGGERGEKGSS